VLGESLTDLDIKIITILMNDASITNLKLSKMIGVSPSVCLARTNRLKRMGVIKQYVAIVDERMLGIGFMAFISITLSKPSRDIVEAVTKHINSLPNVLECYNTSGDNDFLLKVVAKDAMDFRSFVLDELMKVDGIGKISTRVVLNVEKRSFSVLATNNDV